MKRNANIRKVVNASLAFLISALYVASAMETVEEHKGEGVVLKRLRDHDYYKQELQKLEESTRRIHEEVDRILAEFRKNMEEYYKRTRGTTTTTTTATPETVGEQETIVNQLNSKEEANADLTLVKLKKAGEAAAEKTAVVERVAEKQGDYQNLLPTIYPLLSKALKTPLEALKSLSENEQVELFDQYDEFETFVSEKEKPLTSSKNDAGRRKDYHLQEIKRQEDSLTSCNNDIDHVKKTFNNILNELSSLFASSFLKENPSISFNKSYLEELFKKNLTSYLEKLAELEERSKIGKSKLEQIYPNGKAKKEKDEQETKLYDEYLSNFYITLKVDKFKIIINNNIGNINHLKLLDYKKRSDEKLYKVYFSSKQEHMMKLKDLNNHINIYNEELKKLEKYRSLLKDLDTILGQL